LENWDFEFNEPREVPAFLSNLRTLTTLRLAGNDLNDLADFLNNHPKLTRITLGNDCKITRNNACTLKVRLRSLPGPYEGEIIADLGC
jgi:hypothetical protein